MMEIIKSLSPKIIPTLIALLSAQMVQAEYRLESYCLGNAVESCFLYIDGEIDNELLLEIESIGGGLDAQTIYLNSPGGNLGAAVEIGRHIRSLGLNTAIGSLESIEIRGMWPDSFPQNGTCESACAYLFMGGEQRFLNDGTLGMHRFYSNGMELTADNAQIVSAELVSYLVEMGIDARLFLTASLEGMSSMYYISEDEAREYGIATERGFDTVFLEPYGSGIIAATRRMHPVTAYDTVSQVTFFCAQNTRKIMLTSSTPGWTVELQPSSFRLGNRSNVQSFSYPSVDARNTPAASYFTVEISGAALAVALDMLEARQFYIDIPFSRADGGVRGAYLELDEMDVRMINSAWTHCIN